MTYIASQNNRKKGARAPFLIILLIVIVLSILQLSAPSFWSNFFTALARPFWRAQLSIELGSIKSRDNLLQENEYLKRKIDEDAFRLESVKAVEAENLALKTLLGRATTTSLTLAAVLKRPPTVFYDELIIDAGIDHDFAVNDLVYASPGVLIGKISEIGSQTSKVSLFSSPGQKFDILIGEANHPAVANGRGGGEYSAELPREVEVKEGDFVNAPSIHDKVFGVVTATISKASEPFKTILFAPAVNIYNLRWVLVDTKNTLQ